MLILIIVIIFMIGTTTLKVTGQQSLLTDACNSWDHVKKVVESYSEVQLLCNVSEPCTGVDCSAKYKEYKGKVKAVLQPCVNPVGVTVHLSIPQLNIDWNHTFFHEEQVPLPETKFRSSDVKNGQLEIRLQRQDRYTVTFGVSITEPTHLEDNGPMSIVLIKNETLKLPPCPRDQSPELVRQSAIIGQSRALPLNSEIASKNDASVVKHSENDFQAVTSADEKPCRTDLLYECGKNEICEPRSLQSTAGVCHCLSPNQHNSDGFCTIVPSSTDKGVADGPSIDPAPYPSTTQTSIQIAVPILLIVLIAVLVVLAYRYRWITKLRARFRQTRVYEEMLIDSEEVASMNSEGLNPMA